MGLPRQDCRREQLCVSIRSVACPAAEAVLRTLDKWTAAPSLSWAHAQHAVWAVGSVLHTPLEVLVQTYGFLLF